LRATPRGNAARSAHEVALLITTREQRSMKHLLSSLLVSAFLLVCSASAGAASCTSYGAIGNLGGCSGAGARTILGFLTTNPSDVTASATYKGAGGDDSIVPIPAPENSYSVYLQGQGWGAEAATANAAGDAHTSPVTAGAVRASADLATGKLRYFGESISNGLPNALSGSFLSEARFSDIIYLSVPTSLADPVVTFSLAVSGSIAIAGGDVYYPTQTQAQLSVTTVDSGVYLGGANFAASTVDILATSGGSYSAVPTLPINPLSDPYKVLQGDHYLVALKLDAYMFGQSDPGWRFDFENTAQLAITLSDGITYLGSDSGVLLTAVAMSQSIAFAPLPGRTLGDPPFAVSATATSGLPVDFSSLTPAVCTSGGVNGSTVTLVATGTCTIAADQAGNIDYAPAPQVTQSFAVTAPSGAPQFTSANVATFVVKSPNTFAVTASGTPVPTLTRTGALPSGVTFTAATGTLAGAPAGGTVGTYTITFTAANGVPPNATQTFTLTVVKSEQAITFDSLPDVTFGSPSFTLAATSTSGLTVTFASLTPGVCTVNTRTVKLIAAGTCTIAANQAGNANYNPAPQVTRSFAVLMAATTVTTIQASKEPSVTGQPYAVTVTVTSPSGIPKGSVTVDDGHGGTCTDLTLSSTGIASCTMTSTVAGTLTLTAAYAGSAGHAASTGTATHVVNPAVTKVVVTSSADPAFIGTLVTLNAKVSAVAPGKGIPTGTVVFTTGTTVLGTGTLDAGGNAKFSTAEFPIGANPIVANYSGDANYAASVSGTFNQDIVAYPVLQFSATSVTVDETVGSVTLTVVHSGSALGPVTVAYASVDGTATAPGDYAAASGVLSWAAGDGANQTIVVPIVSDGIPEPAKKFTVTLSAPTGATLGARSTITVTIRAN